MATSVYVGLVVTSHTNSAGHSDVYDELSEPITSHRLVVVRSWATTRRYCCSGQVLVSYRPAVWRIGTNGIPDDVFQ